MSVFDHPELDRFAIVHGIPNQFFGTTGDDTQPGTADADIFNFGQGGHDTLSGLGGDDIFKMKASLDPLDSISGGKGNDTVQLNGDYPNLVFNPGTIHGIETILLLGGHDYVLQFDDGNFARGATATIDASRLGPGDTADIYAGEIRNAHLIERGGAGDDRLAGSEGDDALFGGPGDDHFVGNFGADKIVPGGGDNEIIYIDVGESDGKAYDHIVAFDTHHDIFNTATDVAAVDATVKHGTLDAATFDSDFADAVTKHRLGTDHAVLFTPDDGDLAGRVFLVIDDNHKAGYQAGHDYVIDVTGAHHLDDLSVDNFINAIG